MHPPAINPISAIPTESKARKIANLLTELDDVLGDDGRDEMVNIIGETAVSEALNLRSSIRIHMDKARRETSRLGGPSPAAPVAPSPREIGPLTSISTAPKVSHPALGPWKSSMISDTLPALPPVLDPTLEAGAFIHQGYGSGRITDLSYERLEWIGDAYIYLISTLLISQTFPSLLPGKCSQMRERLVKNVTLSDYARRYGFDKRAKLPDTLSADSLYPARDQDKTKIMGDIFEAYVAAVILSDPAGGLVRAISWLKALWGMTVRKEIIQEEKYGLKIDNPLWRLRGSIGLDDPSASVEAPPPNPKERLHKMLGAKGVKLEYKDAAPERKDKETKLPLFTVGVYLTGWGEQNRLLGTGTAHGKKDAGMKAAAMAIQNKKTMLMYTEKKRVFDAQLELERQALEKQEQADA